MSEMVQLRQWQYTQQQQQKSHILVIIIFNFMLMCLSSKVSISPSSMQLLAFLTVESLVFLGYIKLERERGGSVYGGRLP